MRATPLRKAERLSQTRKFSSWRPLPVGAAGVTMATPSSGGSSNSNDFEDFMSEVQDIEKSKTHEDSGEEDTSKTPDGE